MTRGSVVSKLRVAPQAEAGPAASFEELYATYAAFTWRALRHLGLDPTSVDDAVQEVWVVVYRRLREFEGRAGFRTWLFGIAVNVARNHRRRERRHPPSEELPATLVQPETDPQRRDDAREAFALVQRYLETLDDQRREVFACALLEGMSASETAAATGLTVESAQNRVRALRRSFRTWLSRQRRQG